MRQLFELAYTDSTPGFRHTPEVRQPERRLQAGGEVLPAASPRVFRELLEQGFLIAWGILPDMAPSVVDDELANIRTRSSREVERRRKEVHASTR
jgi:hypothetical protein